ncbi:MAG: PfaD family polyunsaturated fatty acid/polyketide biosynthesis protein [Planctomycetota bacterium]|nr:PfaD family polyunsaturated fatty acid/polyketide biosynthesis protein [Planctomycetota bacterium]
MSASEDQHMESWRIGQDPSALSGREILDNIHRFREPVDLVQSPSDGRIGLDFSSNGKSLKHPASDSALRVVAKLPALFPEWLGDRSFCEVHRLRFPYVTGAMANGIASTKIVIEMAKSGMLGFFGAAGLSLDRVEAAIDELQRELGPSGASWGSNLIHSPNEPDLESGAVDLYLRRNVRRISASAFMSLTSHVVRYAATGLQVGPTGRILRRNHVFAKISRPEVAHHFMSPPPQAMLDGLVSEGLLTIEEARLAAKIPVAEDIIAEADSGGHTDNQPLPALFPTILSLRDELSNTHGYTQPIRVGAAGGLGCPSAVAAAFSLGASFVLTGSVNQAAIESGLSDEGKEMLAHVDLNDVMMAPAADMFELGIKLQVIKRGSMFGVRAAKLYEIYTAYNRLEEIPDEDRNHLEKKVFGLSIPEVWADTQRFWAHRDPRENEKAEADPKHKMALCFRWYLGQSSRWAITGEAGRRLDYQIWCGPAMGAFNDWTRGSFLEQPAQRSVVQIALNLLEGATQICRAQQLRSFGVDVPAAAFQFRPRRLSLVPTQNPLSKVS